MTKRNSGFDVIIMGGGPAGLSALLWCAELNLSAILFEKEGEFGGQLLRTNNTIRNYLGIKAANGRELRDTFMSQIEKTHVQRIPGAEIIEADLVKKTVRSMNGSVYSGGAIFLATGVRRRKLMVPGEEEFRGHGILESGITALNKVRGQTVVIVGGGDAALENAIILSKTALNVVVVHRRREFAAREEFVEKASEADNIEFLFDTQIRKIVGNEGVEGVEIERLKTGEFSEVNADAVLIRIGVEPNTELFRRQIDLDDAGYVVIDANCATSLPGVYAGGDVANPLSPTISAAAGQGSTAIKSIFGEVNS